MHRQSLERGFATRSTLEMRNALQIANPRSTGISRLISGSRVLRLWRAALHAAMWAAVVGSASVGFAQGPDVKFCLPWAVAPGASAVVAFHGENLHGPSELWTSFPAQWSLAEIPQPPESSSGVSSFRISLPAEAQAGIGAVRLATTNGISSLHLFMIDDLPSAQESGTNSTRETAQPIRLPTAVDGFCEEMKFDWYRFRGRKGQSISIEVVAQRLGSKLDPVVRLLDERGKELAYSDDASGAWADSRLRCQLPSSGRYWIELRDTNYEGSPLHRYRLRVGDFPLATAAFPLAVETGRKERVNILGRAVEGVRPALVSVLGQAERVPLALRFPGGKFSGFTSVLIRSGPEQVELEPNDQPGQANRLPVPGALSGRFEKAKDPDWYEFDAGKDETIVIRGCTRCFGSPCDLFLQLQSEQGGKVAEAKVVGPDEASLTHRFKQAGRYRLLVEELNRAGGPDLVYRLEIGRPLPFQLNVETDRVNVAAGQTFELKVLCVRHEYDGPVTLSLHRLEEHFALDNQVVAEKKTETTLKVKVPAEMEQGRIRQFRVLGRVKMGEREVTATASTLPALRKLFPDLLFPPPELDGWIGLGIAPASATPDQKQEKALKR
jgi:hypothetical protein